MTNAEMAVKIIDIKLAILKIMSKSNTLFLQKYNFLKQAKQKEIAKVGMLIQNGEDLSSEIDVMTLKSILNSPDFSDDNKEKIFSLCKSTVEKLNN